jgi:hypothetical protein
MDNQQGTNIFSILEKTEKRRKKKGRVGEYSGLDQDRNILIRCRTEQKKTNIF